MITGSERVRGIVPAGVHRWDDGCVDAVVPRTLIPVVQIPLICHGLRALRHAGIRDVTICANSSSHLVRRRLGDGADIGLNLDYFDDLSPRGPAGCVRDAGLSSNADRFVVIEGTIIPWLDLPSLVAEHVRSYAAVTVLVERAAGAAAGDEALTPSGIYVMERAALESVPGVGYQDIKEMLLPRLHARGVRVVPSVREQHCPRVSTLASYLAATEWVLERYLAEGLPLRGYRRIGTSFVHESAEIDASARLVGPVVVGPSCQIAGGTTLIGPTVLGAECRIEAGAVLSRSVLWSRCVVELGGEIDRCVLTEFARVPREMCRHGACIRHDPADGPRRGWRRPGGRKAVGR